MCERRIIIEPKTYTPEQIAAMDIERQKAAYEYLTNCDPGDENDYEQKAARTDSGTPS